MDFQVPSGADSQHQAQEPDDRLPPHFQPHLTASDRPASVGSSNTSIASSDRSRYHNALNSQAAEAIRKLRLGETMSSSQELRFEDAKQQSGEEAQQPYHLRHGFTVQHSAEQLLQLSNNFFMYYGEKRHETGGVPEAKTYNTAYDWRMRDRLKTVNAILPLCLNIGVDPPGGFKTVPCAKSECWVDPAGNAPGNNAMQNIMKNIQAQYEQLSMRTRYKVLSDPTSDEIKKYALTVRRNARDERILFHYNGHGVPEPTPSGELWFFNKNYTQYIPVSLNELQAWLGAPSIWVYDCQQAGRILKNFTRYADKNKALVDEQRRHDPSIQAQDFHDCIQLAATGEEEKLPTNPLLPADLFTCCLTSPIEMAVRFYIMQSPLRKKLDLEDAHKIPGRNQERRTPLGELNWIFTAITDTIAWHRLPRKIFKRLFRQDLMVAALFRNFLLAQRVMKAYHCHPESSPAIPDTSDHPLWASWDLAVELVLAQLPDLLHADEKRIEQIYHHSDFFKDQLTAFEVYLDHGAREQKEPDQLPIVLQVLLSQSHRLRALILLSRFLDMGPWAVKLALGIGIFPYVLKLLQSQAPDLKPPLVFIWARILAVDHSCQQDLLKDNGYQYFAQIMNPSVGLPVNSVSEHRAMCAFIIAVFCHNFKPGQAASYSAEVVQNCLKYISLHVVNNPVLRQWSCLCLSTLWQNYSEPKWIAIRNNGHVTMCHLVSDPVPEVRASMLRAMTTFIGVTDMTDQVMAIEEEIALRLTAAAKDSCVIVRKELTVFLSAFCHRYMRRIIVAALEVMHEELYHVLAQLQKDVHEEAGDDTTDSKPVVNGGLRGNRSEVAVANSVSTGNGSIQTNGSPNVSFSTARRRSMSGTTFDSASLQDDQYLNGTRRNHLPKQSRAKDSAYMAVWLHVLILSLDPDIQVSRNAAMIVQAVAFAMTQEATVADLSEDFMDIYSEFMGSAITTSAATSSESHQAQTPAPAAQSPADTTKHDGYLSIGMRRTASVAASLANLAGFGSTTTLSTAANTHSPPKPTRTDTLSRQSTFSSKSYGDLTQISEESERPGNYRKCQFPYPEWWTKPDNTWTPTLPLQSDFFEYAAEYFKINQMKNEEHEEPGSNLYNERLWRRNRNEAILDQTQRLKEQASTSRWDHLIGYFNNGFQPSKMAFHQYESHVVIADDCDNIRVWDWERQKSLNRFSNGNAIGTRVNDMRLINEDDQALLLTASSDGSIRLFKEYDTRNQTSILTSFSALPRPDSHVSNFSLCMDWLQTRGEILTAGDSKSIRVWSAPDELLSNEIRTISSARVTALTSDQVQGDMICAGFEDGTVRVYDQRMHRLRGLVRTWREHDHSPVVNLHMQRGGLRELISCSENGVVKLWDAQNEVAIQTVKTTRDAAVSVSVHEHAPVFAVGTSRHKIRVFNTDGDTLSTWEPLAALRQQTRPTAPISNVSFHPHRMMLACASTGDNWVSLYKCRTS